ncbi:hypothetical protein GCM10008915_36030 [Bifidobacterium pullorum subsp. gallinarum]
MPIIPLKQTAMHAKLIGTDPDYGDPIYADPVALKCRFQEGAKLVRDRHGDEVVSVGTFLFNKIVEIGFSDTLTFTNELGTVRTHTPIAIGVKRDVSGKPLFTEVNV